MSGFLGMNCKAGETLVFHGGKGKKLFTNIHRTYILKSQKSYDSVKKIRSE